jgi:hypothetical protein
MTAASRLTVIGHFHDMASARRAIDALQNRGIDPIDIELVGEGAERAAQRAEAEVTAPQDAGVARRIVLRAIPAALLGAAIGVVIGAVVAATVGGSSTGSYIGAQILTFSTGGFLLGALVAAYSGISQGEAWNLTFEPDQGKDVGVAIRNDDPAVVDRAIRVLHHKDAEVVERSSG